MVRYLIAFAVFSPLIGVILMELGAYSFSANEVGYENGASLMYALYIFLLYLAYFITQKWPVALFSGRSLGNQLNYTRISLISIVFCTFFLLLILFGFGGYKIWLGQIDKGAFRIGLGAFGAFAYLMVKTFLPSLIALNCFLFKKLPIKKNKYKILLVLNCVLAFLFGASWGFKSTAVFILLPGFIILFWRIRIITLLKFSLITFGTFLLFSVLFDNASLDTTAVNLLETQGGSNALEATLYRITVLQGDACWKIWDLYTQDQLREVEYYKILVSMIGDKNLDLLFGINQSDYYNFITYHFGLLLTYLCGNSPDAIAQGYNVTGTVFSEGLMAGGIPGLIFFSLFAGFLTGIVKNLIQEGMQKGKAVITSIAVSYFCFSIFAWLNGGGVDSLFHISILFGIILTYIFLIVIVQISNSIQK